jgi:hypothetical protein
LENPANAENFIPGYFPGNEPGINTEEGTKLQKMVSGIPAAGKIPGLFSEMLACILP